MFNLSNNSNTSEGISQPLKTSDFPIFRTATVIDPKSNYCGKTGKIVANNYAVDLAIEGVKTPRGKQRSIGFKPEQLRLNPAPQEWKPPAMPWTKNTDAPWDAEDSGTLLNPKPSISEFSRAWREECLTGSGIDPDLYCEAIDFLSEVEQTLGGDAILAIHEALGWSQSNYRRFVHDIKEPLEVAVFRNEDGSVWQCRLSIPFKDEKGKEQKYLAPKREITGGSIAYFPPVPRKIRLKIADRLGIDVPLEGSFWDWVKRTPLVPITLTEGGKKALKLLSEGIIAISLYGCSGGAKTKDEDKNPVEPQLIPDLQWIGDGRIAYMALDRDTNPKAKKNVDRALNLMGKLLVDRGATVKVLLWDCEAGKGIDDYLVGGGNPNEIYRDATPLIFKYRSDEEKEDKKSLAQRLLEITQNKCKLFHDSLDKAYADIQRDGHRETYPLKSTQFTTWLNWELYRETGIAANASALADAITVLTGKALFEGEERDPFIRVGNANGKVYLDLGRDDWQAVEIDAGGWRLVSDYPIRFIRPKCQQSLPIPMEGGNIHELDRLINLGENWQLVLSWLSFCLFPEHPHPILILHGQQGSGKSTTARILKNLLDPCKSPLLGKISDLRDLAVNASHRWILAFDNLSGISTVLSDALCCLSTGGGFATRALFTDDDEAIFEHLRPVILTGIDAIATRGDLLERSILVELPQIGELERIEEKELRAIFQEVHPYILGAMLDAASATLARVQDVKLTALPRMADFARWASAAEIPLGYSEGSFLRAYTENREEAHDRELETNPVAAAIVRFMEEQNLDNWEGAAGALLNFLEGCTEPAVVKSKRWVGSATGLGMAIPRLAPILRSSGISIERGSRTMSSRTIVLKKFTDSDPRCHRCHGISEPLPGEASEHDTFENEGVIGVMKGVIDAKGVMDGHDTFDSSMTPYDTLQKKGVMPETPASQGVQEPMTPMTPLAQTSEKNTEDEKVNKLLPIGIWVLRKGKDPLTGKTETRRYQVVDHVPGGEAFQSPEGHYVSHLDPSEYEILQGEFRTVNGISPGSKVRYNESAIAKIERSRAKPGTNDPWDKNWIYEVIWIDDRGWTRLKRCGGGKGKKLVEQMIGCFEVAE